MILFQLIHELIAATRVGHRIEDQLLGFPVPICLVLFQKINQLDRVIANLGRVVGGDIDTGPRFYRDQRSNLCCQDLIQARRFQFPNQRFLCTLFIIQRFLTGAA